MKRPVETLTHAEHETLERIAAAKSRRDSVLVLLMGRAGLRVGEAVGLRWTDVSADGSITRWVSIPSTLARRGSARLVPMDAKLHEALLEHAVAEGQVMGQLQADEPVARVPGRVGPMCVRNGRRIVYELSKTALGRRIHPHVLRHTFGTRLLKVCDIRTVQELMGHRHLSSTMIYTHVSQADMQGAIRAAFEPEK